MPKRKKLRLALVIVFALGIVVGSGYLINVLKVSYVNKKYLRSYIAVEKLAFAKGKDRSNAVVMILVENAGKRMLDSLPVEIAYYDYQGKMLGRDKEDILRFTKSLLFPQTKRMIEVTVSCPDSTTDARVKVQY